MVISKHTHYTELLGDIEHITNNINGGESLIPVFVEGYSIPDACNEGWLRGGLSFDIPEMTETADFASLIDHINRYNIQR